MNNSEMRRVAAFRFDDAAPLGTVFDRTEQDWSVEEKYFSDWTVGITPPSYWGRSRSYFIAQDETEGRVLEHFNKIDNVLLAGHDLWRDYEAAARVRQFLADANATPDDESCVIGRTGIVFRQKTTRRYYFFGIEALDRFVLYRRCDTEYAPLAVVKRPVDRRRYYDLRIEVKGTRIRCFVDGEAVADLRDDAYAAGKCGIRTSTMARVAWMTVDMSESDHAAFLAEADRAKVDAAAAGARLPKPELWREIDAGLARLQWAGRPTPTSEAMVLMLDDPAQASGTSEGFRKNFPCALRLMTVGGETVWRRNLAGTVRPLRHVCCGDLSGNGGWDVAAVLNDRIVILDGRTGETRHERELPQAGLFNGYRHERTTVAQPNVVRFRPAPAPCGILLREDAAAGGNTLWAYDERLSPLWTWQVSQPRFGHSGFFSDVDGDGCEEILIGCHLIDQDGRTLWELEDSAYFDYMNGARHCDNVFIGKLHAGSDRLTTLHAGGGDGLFYADGKTGRVLSRHMLGHVQHVEPGRLRPEMPGLQVCAATRWGNFGIMTILDNDGRELCQFQPDYDGERFVLVRWTAEQDLILIQRSREAAGFWDGWGRRVMALPPGLPVGMHTVPLVADVCGDARQEIIVADEGKVRIYTQGATST